MRRRGRKERKWKVSQVYDCRGIAGLLLFSFLFFFCVFLFFMLLSSSSWPFINLASLFITTGDAFFPFLLLIRRPHNKNRRSSQKKKNSAERNLGDLGKMVTPRDRDGGCCWWWHCIDFSFLPGCYETITCLDKKRGKTKTRANERVNSV